MDIVFIHYFGGNGKSWQWLAGYMHNYKCHYLTMPGFGNTEAYQNPDINKMADFVLGYLSKNQIKQCILVGHSMGGKIALLTAAKASIDLVKKVVLIAPSPPTIEAMPEDEKERMLIHPDKREAATTVSNGTYAELLPELKEFCIHSQLQVDEVTWKWWLQQGMQHTILPDIQNLKVSLYLIYSDDDKAITPKMIQEEVIPNLVFSKIYKTAKVGHLIPVERPEYLAKILKEILTE